MRDSQLVRRAPQFLFRRSLVLLGLAVSAASASAQAGWDPAGFQLTRQELETLLKKHEETRGTAEAELIRKRLTEGDFQVGDQVELEVEGEPNMSKVFSVAPNRQLPIPGLGDLSLAGVLRSELQEHVRAYIARFIHNPRVRTKTMIRLAVLGSVGEPGFHAVPAHALLSDLITVAGGPAPGVKLTRAYVQRGDAKIWEGKVLQEAIAAGRTLDQMSLRSGDQFMIPDEDSGRATLFRALAIIPTTILAITALIQLSR